MIDRKLRLTRFEGWKQAGCLWFPFASSCLIKDRRRKFRLGRVVQSRRGRHGHETDKHPWVEASKTKAFLILAAVVGLSLPQFAASDMLLTNVTLVDVESEELTEGQHVLIEGTRIVSIGPDISTAVDTPRFDGGGGYLVPGLWDSHVHIFSSPVEPETALSLFLINGVTGIWDMGALWPLPQQKVLQAKIETGQRPGPRLILSGAWVDASPGSWPGMFLADSPQEARRVAD